jgi:hypothetical protein
MRPDRLCLSPRPLKLADKENYRKRPPCQSVAIPRLITCSAAGADDASTTRNVYVPAPPKGCWPQINLTLQRAVQNAAPGRLRLCAWCTKTLSVVTFIVLPIVVGPSLLPMRVREWSTISFRFSITARPRTEVEFLEATEAPNRAGA